MNEEWRKQALQLIIHEVTKIAEANGGTAEVEISKGYPYLDNDPQLTKRLKTALLNFYPPDDLKDLPIRMTSEDFSFYAQEVPACFFRIGVASQKFGSTFGVHHPQFDIEPEALIHGMRALALAPFTNQ